MKKELGLGYGLPENSMSVQFNASLNEEQSIQLVAWDDGGRAAYDSLNLDIIDAVKSQLFSDKIDVFPNPTTGLFDLSFNHNLNTTVLFQT